MTDDSHRQAAARHVPTGPRGTREPRSTNQPRGIEAPLPGESEAIREGEEEFARGTIHRLDDVLRRLEGGRS